MVVLDQFYQIVEAETAKISIFWKVAHVLVFMIAGVCGFLAAFTFGQVLDNFNYNCLLNAHIVFDNTSHFPISTGNQTKYVRAIDVTQTLWGPSSECNFAQFTPLFTMISALVWGVFFIILAKGGAGYATDLLSKPWRIIYPCIFFCIITLITHLISALKLQYGLSAFCDQFKPELNNTGCVPEINTYSEQQFIAEDMKLEPFTDFNMNQQVAVISSQIGVWAWVVQLILLISRACCVVDFDLHLVTIQPKDEELVEKVIEFHDVDEGINQSSQV